ncbi:MULTISPECIES: ribose 5-phosphate isomerase A [Acidiphilium]|uniref:ribose 5-phosphate isomerase A n=1 Tax=Acidiphilium TaxID=522 RepID=UPI00257B953C|nr:MULTISPECIES: ribose 5-phosphate isomerase A [Acidiphilium]HQT84620.1 ribose 5-phosphate isomerase A [Acidiphilium rubrum]
MGAVTGATMIATPDQQKRAAAREAALLVETGMYLGLGTGSTVGYFLDALSERIKAESLSITCVATSLATERRAAELGIGVVPLSGMLDLAIDGADEVAFGTLHLIKGLGGALLREKQIAESARQFVVIADESKLVRWLGERTPLPVEIVDFAVERTIARIGDIGLPGVLRMSDAATPYRTDNGNQIVDCTIAVEMTPPVLEATLKTIAGVVETGLFTHGCAAAIIGMTDGSTRRFDGDPWARAGVASHVATLRSMGLPLPHPKPVIAVMGVSASGKSTIGALLAACLGVAFIDGDDLHPQSNRAKMHAGHPLNDNDRLPWLHRIAGALRGWRDAGCGGVIVSSLLTRHYRDLVRSGCAGLILVNLTGRRDLLAKRAAGRHGHFMPPDLLDSQFATLEPPGADETVMNIDVDASPIAIVTSIMQRLAEGV